MPIVESELAPLRNPRLAALATSAWPAWLWSVDGSQILWANAVGAAIFGAATTAACAQRRFDAGDASAAQIIRLAATLPTGAPERLERLRGFGADFGRALTCACSRIVLADGKAAVLIAAAEPAGPALTLGERVRRLFADRDEALAGFAPDGTLLHANAAALARLAGATTLSALGIETLAATALETGSARGTRSSMASRSRSCRAPRQRGFARAALTLTPQPVEAPRLRKRPGKAGAGACRSGARAAVEAPPVAPPVSRRPRPTAAPDEPIPERRHPLRFVWHMDADGRFGVGSDEFIELVGPRTTAAFGRPWSEIADELKLDPDNLVARAVATRETWSGIIISWPVDDSSERLPIELSGLPVFDRDRSFRGYRGFGVCRDIDRINRSGARAPGAADGFHAGAGSAAANPRRTLQPPVPKRRRSGASAGAPSARASRRPPPMSCRFVRRRRPNPRPNRKPNQKRRQR